MPRFAWFFCALGLSAVAAGQAPAKINYKLLSIHVSGLHSYSEQEVISASGLKLGEFAGEEQFQQAVDKLGQTGVFSQLSYTYKYSAAGCDLELQAAENDRLLPLAFENLVWFSDNELVDLLRSRIPLFQGRVPDRGNLVDQIALALTDILHQHKISGEVQYAPIAAHNGPVESYQLKVAFHPVLVRNVDFAGAAPDDLPPLQAAAKQISGEDYQQTTMRLHERLSFLPLYRARGYLKAGFGDPQPKIVEDGAQTVVDVVVPVTPGIQYKFSDVDFAGNRIFPADRLRELIHLKPNQPANAVELDEDLDQIRKVYATKGYLFAAIEPVPSMNDSTALVSYEIKVDEGDVYRMGELNIDGLPEENANRITAQWQIKKGEPFDDSYMQRFFSILYRDFGLHQSYEVASRKAIDQQAKTVSVSLHFVPRT